MLEAYKGSSLCSWRSSSQFRPPLLTHPPFRHCYGVVSVRHCNMKVSVTDDSLGSFGRGLSNRRGLFYVEEMSIARKWTTPSKEHGYEIRSGTEGGEACMMAMTFFTESIDSQQAEWWRSMYATAAPFSPYSITHLLVLENLVTSHL